MANLIDKDALLADIADTIDNSGCVNHEREIMDCIRYAHVHICKPEEIAALRAELARLRAAIDGSCDGCVHDDQSSNDEPCCSCTRIHSVDHYESAALEGGQQ